jgi:hypothetical protein
MPRKQGAIIGLGIPLGAISLFPQRIIPAVLKLARGRSPKSATTRIGTGQN